MDDNVFEVTSVEYDDTISFKVELQTAYSESTVVVKNNGLALTAVEGVYTVENITENVTITVEGVQKNTYTVTLPTERTGYTLKNANDALLTITSLEYGADLTFKVAVDEGYSASANNLVVACNTTPLEANNGVYTVANVTANIEITVSGLTLNSYTITFLVDIICQLHTIIHRG